jgi:mannonate dehydratase
MRMMSEKKYNGLLFGETSAQVQFNRLAKPITAILKNPEIQKRLVNGSDYPLPAINIIIRTTKLVELGLISDQERICLNEIYDYNPLLFDFVLKRTIRTKSGEKLSPNLFLRNKEIF